MENTKQDNITGSYGLSSLPAELDNFVPKNPEYRETVKEKLTGQHFMRHIGFELTKIKPGYVEGEGPIQKFLTQQDGFIHGGVSSTLADIVCGFAAFTLVEKGVKVVTGELKAAYFKPGKGDTIIARGYVVKPGKRMNFCEGDIYVRDKKNLYKIARAYTTMVSFIPGDTKK